MYFILLAKFAFDTTGEEKQQELPKYRDPNLVTIDFDAMLFIKAGALLDHEAMARHQKAEVLPLYEKGKLSTPKRWLHDKDRKNSNEDIDHKSGPIPGCH